MSAANPRRPTLEDILLARRAARIRTSGVLDGTSAVRMMDGPHDDYDADADYHRIGALARLAASNPRAADLLMQRSQAFGFSSEMERANWIPELPQDVARQADLESRLPEADFVPDTVTDPRLRDRMQSQIRARQARNTQRRRRNNQWGGVVQLAPPGSPLLLPKPTPTVVGGGNYNFPTSAPYSTSGNLFQWTSEDDDPQDINIQLSYSLDQPSTLSSDDISIYAKIEWGSGGANQFAFCDVQQGTQLRLTGTYVRGSGYYLPLNLPSPYPTVPVQYDGFIPTGPGVTLSAMLGRGHPTFNTSSARFTRKFMLAAVGNPGANLVADPIPPFASAFGLVVGNIGALATPVNLQVGFSPNPLIEGGTPLYAFTYNGGAQNTPSVDFAYSLPQGMRNIYVTNLGAGPVAVAIVYALMMG